MRTAIKLLGGRSIDDDPAVEMWATLERIERVTPNQKNDALDQPKR